MEQTWVNSRITTQNNFPSTAFELLPNFQGVCLFSESLAVIQKLWRENCSELKFVN